MGLLCKSPTMETLVTFLCNYDSQCKKLGLTVVYDYCCQPRPESDKLDSIPICKIGYYDQDRKPTLEYGTLSSSNLPVSAKRCIARTIGQKLQTLACCILENRYDSGGCGVLVAVIDYNKFAYMLLGSTKTSDTGTVNRSNISDLLSTTAVPTDLGQSTHQSNNWQYCRAAMVHCITLPVSYPFVRIIDDVTAARGDSYTRSSWTNDTLLVSGRIHNMSEYILQYIQQVMSSTSTMVKWNQKVWECKVVQGLYNKRDYNSILMCLMDQIQLLGPEDMLVPPVDNEGSMTSRTRGTINTEAMFFLPIHIRKRVHDQAHPGQGATESHVVGYHNNHLQPFLPSIDNIAAFFIYIVDVTQDTLFVSHSVFNTLLFGCVTPMATLQSISQMLLRVSHDFGLQHVVLLFTADRLQGCDETAKETFQTFWSLCFPGIVYMYSGDGCFYGGRFQLHGPNVQ